MEKQEHKTSADVKAGLQIAANTKPGEHHITGLEQAAATDKEIDPDEAVHAQADTAPLKEEEEKDIDDVVHTKKQPEQDTDEERDVDDLIHRK